MKMPEEKDSMLAMQIINESSDYDLRVNMARNNRPIDMWENLTRKWVRNYAKIGQKFTAKEVKIAAKELKAYYEDHVKELDS